MTDDIDCTMYMTHNDMIMFVYIFSGDLDKYVPDLDAIKAGKMDHMDLKVRGAGMENAMICKFKIRIYVKKEDKI